MIAKDEDYAASIPVVDFAKWNDEQSTKEDHQKIARQLVEACRNVGFVYIVNHGITDEALQNIFAMSKKLFDLKHEEKMLAPHPPGPEVHRGYSYPGLEKVSQTYGTDIDVPTKGEELREVQDVKESYEVGSETNPEQPNVWLPEHVLPGFRTLTSSFYWSCDKVSKNILEAIALGLGLEDTKYFYKFHSGHGNQLRLLHYPPVPAADIESKRSARMPAHTDWGSITMLFQDECGGLQVEDPHVEGRFLDAIPLRNACIMNVGDLLMRWTNDQLKSTMHRVTLPPLSDRFEGAERMTRARYSVPYFVSPDSDAEITCIAECTSVTSPPQYEPLNFGQYRAMRGALQYRK